MWTHKERGESGRRWEEVMGSVMKGGEGRILEGWYSGGTATLPVFFFVFFRSHTLNVVHQFDLWDAW